MFIRNSKLIIAFKSSPISNFKFYLIGCACGDNIGRLAMKVIMRVDSLGSAARKETAAQSHALAIFFPLNLEVRSSSPCEYRGRYKHFCFNRKINSMQSTHLTSWEILLDSCNCHHRKRHASALPRQSPQKEPI